MARIHYESYERGLLERLHALHERYDVLLAEEVEPDARERAEAARRVGPPTAEPTVPSHHEVRGDGWVYDRQTGAPVQRWFLGVPRGRWVWSLATLERNDQAWFERLARLEDRLELCHRRGWEALQRGLLADCERRGLTQLFARHPWADSVERLPSAWESYRVAREHTGLTVWSSQAASGDAVEESPEGTALQRALGHMRSLWLRRAAVQHLLDRAVAGVVRDAQGRTRTSPHEAWYYRLVLHGRTRLYVADGAETRRLSERIRGLGFDRAGRPRVCLPGEDGP